MASARAVGPICPRWRARTAVNLVAHSHLYGRLAPIDGVHVLLSGAGTIRCAPAR